ncbi:MAG TPA: hypothetical protein VHA14_01900 [Bryobacteraceae bacterium]|nr:hypothetical protein [Bryobacteraceae bacterium]
MRHKIISISLSVSAGILLTAAVLRSQMPSAGPQWEYATVTGSPGQVTLCYSGSFSCKNERSGSASEAVMNAATKLGDKGWELAAVATSNGDRPERVLYFKRLKSVIYRNEDRR